MVVDLHNTMQKLVLANPQLGFGSRQVLPGVRIDVNVAEAFALRQPLREYCFQSRAVGDFQAMADDVTQSFNVPAALSSVARQNHILDDGINLVFPAFA